MTPASRTDTVLLGFLTVVLVGLFVIAFLLVQAA